MHQKLSSLGRRNHLRIASTLTSSKFNENYEFAITSRKDELTPRVNLITGKDDFKRSNFLSGRNSRLNKPMDQIDTNRDEELVKLLEIKIKELESKNEFLRNRCKEIRVTKIKVLKNTHQNSAKWRLEKKELTELNQKLMKMMENVRKKMAYLRNDYE